MSTFVQDSSQTLWMILSPIRNHRPVSTDTSSHQTRCPFCLGNEADTPPEIVRIASDTNADTWDVRIVPNKYPLADIHEVIIHSPDHEHPLETLSPGHVSKIFSLYQQRYEHHKHQGAVVLFCNQGKTAGASLAHPHSQLVVIPKETMSNPLVRQPIANVIKETAFFTIYCPTFSEWPYEVCIAPKTTQNSFGEITPEEVANLSEILPTTLRALHKIVAPTGAFDYNYYVSSDTNWFLRIIPRVIYRAGFEYATRILVNTVDPTEAAEKIRTHISQDM